MIICGPLKPSHSSMKWSWTVPTCSTNERSETAMGTGPSNHIPPRRNPRRRFIPDNSLGPQAFTTFQRKVKVDGPKGRRRAFREGKGREGGPGFAWSSSRVLGVAGDWASCGFWLCGVVLLCLCLCLLLPSLSFLSLCLSVCGQH